MIEYVEVRDINRSIIGIIDTAQSIIWHSVYYGVGDFEIYAVANQKHIGLLKKGNYITRLDNKEVGIIEEINVTFDLTNGRMIKATGRFAKSILDRRLIYNLDGKTNKATLIGRIQNETVEMAARNLVYANAINCSFDSKRNIGILELPAAKGYTQYIVDEEGRRTEKQVSYENLLTYTDSLLEEYEMSSRIILDTGTKKLQYEVFIGEDKSSEIVFSQEFDNLVSSDYLLDTKSEKNVALIGGEGEGLDRFYSLLGNTSGLTRRELFVDASSIKKKYKYTPEGSQTEVEATYSDADYKKVLNAQGAQTLAPLVEIESFNGSIDITNSIWKINEDFSLGDKVIVQDNEIGKYIVCRIVETLEAQDENGYTIEAIYK